MRRAGPLRCAESPRASIDTPSRRCSGRTSKSKPASNRSDARTGWLAIGSAMLSLTSSGFEQYFVLGSAISEQVLSEGGPALSCKPIDEAHARELIGTYGAAAVPTTADAIGARRSNENRRARRQQAKDLRAGLKLALTSMWSRRSFCSESRLRSPTRRRRRVATRRLYRCRACRSCFGDSTPDAELLAAARTVTSTPMKDCSERSRDWLRHRAFDRGASVLRGYAAARRLRQSDQGSRDLSEVQPVDRRERQGTDARARRWTY